MPHLHGDDLTPHQRSQTRAVESLGYLLFKDPARETIFLQVHLKPDIVLTALYSFNFKIHQKQTPLKEIKNNFFDCSSANKSLNKKV